VAVDLTSLGDQPSDCINFVPPELVGAFKKGDYVTIERYSDISARDLDPIFANMQQHGDNAWIQIINKSNQTPYWISIAGPSGNPTGYMWAYTPPAPNKSTAVGDDPSFIHTVQVGTLSKNSKFLGVSNQLWDNKALSVTAAVISTIVTTVMTRYIAGRIANTAFAAAMTSAINAAGAKLVTLGIVTQAGWLAGATTAAKVVGGGVGGAILTLLIMFIADFVWREYKCCINVYNWTNKDVSVSDWWGDNARIDNDQNFVKAGLPLMTSMCISENEPEPEPEIEIEIEIEMTDQSRQDCLARWLRGPHNRKLDCFLRNIRFCQQ
jgi:hypothetical protein